MNDPINWDPSLIKKFSSSNHYKLLNQLRNEVKKYPLNNKKKALSTQTKDMNPDKNKINFYNAQNSSYSKDSLQINESDANKSYVSFNNAKNFSIYNQTSSNNTTRHVESNLSNQSNLCEDNSSQSFKERLNQIDMK